LNNCLAGKGEFISRDPTFSRDGVFRHKWQLLTPQQRKNTERFGISLFWKNDGVHYKTLKQIFRSRWKAGFYALSSRPISLSGRDKMVFMAAQVCGIDDHRVMFSWLFFGVVCQGLDV